MGQWLKFTTQLPLELLDIITDLLQDDTPTLKACCLSFRSIRFSSQRHLFKIVHLASLSNDKPGSCEGLRAITQISPHIRPNIREVRLHAESDPTSPLLWINEDHDALPALLESLPNVQNIHLVSVAARPLVWCHLPTRVRAAIMQILSTSHIHGLTLKCVAFENTSEFMSVFEAASHLKELYMCVACVLDNHASFKSTATSGYNTAVDTSRSRPCLESLWLKQSTGTISDFAAFPDTKYCMDALLHPRSSLDITSRLRKFAVTVHPDDDHWPLQALFDKAEMLEELIIEVEASGMSCVHAMIRL